MAREIDLREEAEFADAEYAGWEHLATTVNEEMFEKYRNPHQLWDWRQRAAQLMAPLEGAQLLDLGCGQGEESAYFARLGAQVTAIDISPKGIEIARRRAEAAGLGARITATVMSATPTEFAGGSFDIVHGMGILHHIGLRPGLEEVHRVLKPGGRGVFLEPLGSSPAVEAWKSRIHGLVGPRLGLRPITSGEENLVLSEVEALLPMFSAARVFPYHLVHRVRKLFLPRSLYPLALRFDSLALRMVPALRHFAGAAVIFVEK